MNKLFIALWIIFGVSVLTSFIWIIIRFGIGEIILELLEAIVEIFTGAGD